MCHWAEFLEYGGGLECDLRGVELGYEGALDPQRLWVVGEPQAEALRHLHARLGARPVLLGVPAAPADAADLERLEGVVDGAGVEDPGELGAGDREEAAAGDAEPHFLRWVALAERFEDRDLFAGLCDEPHALLPLHLLRGAPSGHQRPHLEGLHLHNIKNRALPSGEVGE